MKKQYCPYCWPTKRKYHFSFHIEYYLEKTVGAAAQLLKRVFGGKGEGALNYLWGSILEFFSLFKLISFTSNPDETKLPSQSLIFFHEAKKRGVDIKAIRFFGKYINEFKFRYQGKSYYFESIPLTMKKSPFDIDNKYKVKALLQKNNIPVPKGKVFVLPSSAIKFAKGLDYPLVVKPNTGSLSWHITCPVNSQVELKKAIRIAKKYRPDFLVEEYVEGELHRAAVIGQQYVFVSKKEKANVIGNGSFTIEELIQKKNQDSKRGELFQKNTTLYKIPLDAALEQNLALYGLTLNSVLAEDKKLYLQEKVILACGCDIINLTKETHPDNIELFLRVAKLLETDVVGVDIICADITKPYTEQKAAIIETNSLPHIDMHQFPSHGEGSPVAEMVWNVVLAQLNNSKGRQQ